MSSKKIIVIQVHVKAVKLKRDFGIKIEVFEPGIITLSGLFIVGKGETESNGESKTR